jgi:hypothetical protein
MAFVRLLIYRKKFVDQAALLFAHGESFYWTSLVLG